jgi:hypothetical protein
VTGIVGLIFIGTLFREDCSGACIGGVDDSVALALQAKLRLLQVEIVSPADCNVQSQTKKYKRGSFHSCAIRPNNY